MVDVNILMSTYNGEKYIEEQLDSIINQDFKGRIKITVRDDGSADKTVALVRKYENSDNRIIEIIEGNNLGPQKSFLELIRIADAADYYFFSDQDDIWYPHKISEAVSMLETVSEPACYCTNYDLYNDNLKQKRECIIKEKPTFTPIKSLLYNQIPGCVMGFNYKLMSILKKLELNNIMMHDSMVLSLAASTGTIIYNDKASISHRIHGNNVVGEGHKKIIPHKWIVEKIKLVINKDAYDISEMAEEFIRNAQIKKEYISDLYLLRDYKKSMSNTLRLLKHKDSHDVFLDRTTLSIRFKILLHVF